MKTEIKNNNKFDGGIGPFIFLHQLKVLYTVIQAEYRGTGQKKNI